jgi:hypothetical protein
LEVRTVSKTARIVMTGTAIAALVPLAALGSTANASTESRAGPPRVQVTWLLSGFEVGGPSRHVVQGGITVAVAVRAHGGLGTGAFGEALEAASIAVNGHVLGADKATRAVGVSNAPSSGSAASEILPVMRWSGFGRPRRSERRSNLRRPVRRPRPRRRRIIGGSVSPDPGDEPAGFRAGSSVDELLAAEGFVPEPALTAGTLHNRSRPPSAGM